MPHPARPLSPHLGIYRWQSNMITSVLHRATGIALVAGSILVLVALLTLAAGPQAFSGVQAFCTSWIGIVLLVGWTWSLAFHLVNGIRHLAQDTGKGFSIPEIVRNSMIALIGSVALTAAVWIWVFCAGGAA